MTRRSALGLFDVLVQGVTVSGEYPVEGLWTWVARLYTDPTWDLVAEIPASPRNIAGHIDATCLATTSRTATLEQWQAINNVADVGLASGRARIVALAWSTALHTRTDEYDPRAGNDFGGLETVLPAILRRYPSPIATIFINDACTTRKYQLSASDRRIA